MIKSKKGDLIKALEDGEVQVAGHQTNALGIAGAGIALTIRRKYENWFKEYYDFCEKFSKPPVGKLQIVEVGKNKYIANLFGQEAPAEYRNQVATNYEALEKSMIELRKWAEDNKIEKIGMPTFLGCGLAHGKWEIVSKIINDVFENSFINVTLYELD